MPDDVEPQTTAEIAPQYRSRTASEPVDAARNTRGVIMMRDGAHLRDRHRRKRCYRFDNRAPLLT